MKVLTIGRDESCDICIDDSTNQVSRRHAILRLYPFGKMEIVPEGTNLTYLNGRPLKNGQAYKVKRKDIISLAKVKSLDWKQIPNPYTPYRIAFYAFCAVLLLMIAFLLARPYFPSGTDGSSGSYPEMEIGGNTPSGDSFTPSEDKTTEQKTDSTKNKGLGRFNVIDDRKPKKEKSKTEKKDNKVEPQTIEAL